MHVCMYGTFQNNPFAIDDQDGGYEYISFPKRQPPQKCSGTLPKPLRTTQTVHTTSKRKSESDQQSVANTRQETKAPKVIRKHSDITNDKTNHVVDEGDVSVPKRGAAITKPPPPPPRTSSGDKSLPRLERKLRSGSVTKTPPLPPRKFGKRKLAHHSSKNSVKSTDSHKSSKTVNKSSRSSSTSLRSGSQKVLTLSEVKDISQDELDSTTAVYWEIGDVVSVDDSASQQHSSLRHSVSYRKQILLRVVHLSAFS